MWYHCYQEGVAEKADYGAEEQKWNTHVYKKMVRSLFPHHVLARQNAHALAKEAVLYAMKLWYLKCEGPETDTGDESFIVGCRK